MRKTLGISTLAMAVALMAGGGALATDPPGSAPSGPSIPRASQPRDPGPSMPLPTPHRGPTDIGIGHHFPPPPPPGGLVDPSAGQDALVDALLGISVPLPPPSAGAPQSFATADGQGPVAILEEECQYNPGGAKCTVYDCDGDGICVEYGTYCVDDYGHVGAC